MTLQHAHRAALKAADFLDRLPVLDGLEVAVEVKDPDESDDGVEVKVAWKNGSFEARFNTDLTVTSDVEVSPSWEEQFDPWRVWALSVAQYLAVGTNPATRTPFGPHTPFEIDVPSISVRWTGLLGPVSNWKVLMTDPAGPLVIGIPIFSLRSAVDAMSEKNSEASLLDGHSIRWVLRVRVYDYKKRSWGWSAFSHAAEADDSWANVWYHISDRLGSRMTEDTNDSLVGRHSRGKILVEEINEVVVGTIGGRTSTKWEKPTLMEDLGFVEKTPPKSDPLISRMISGVVPYRNRDVRFVVEVRYDNTDIEDHANISTMSLQSARAQCSSYMSAGGGREAFAIIWADDPEKAPATFEGVACVSEEWIDRKLFCRRYVNGDIYPISVRILAERECDMGHWHADDDAFASICDVSLVDGVERFAHERLVAEVIEDHLDESVIAALRNR